MITKSNLLQTAVNVGSAVLGKRTPAKVTYYITYRCNLKCAFCGRRNLKSEELTTSQAKEMMTAFRQRGTQFWGFNGGEPLLRKDLGELALHGKELGLKCSISTNATLVPERIDEMEPFDLVLVSIDGPRDLHDSIRGPGMYDKAVEAIKMLRQRNTNTLILTTLTKQNLQVLEQVLDLAEEHDCHFEAQPIVVHRADVEGQAKSFFPTPQEMEQAMSWLIEQKAAGRKVTNSDQFLEVLKQYPDLNIKQKCWAGKLFCSVSPSGRVLPCAELLANEDKFPSGLDTGFIDAFESLPDMAKCTECYFSCYMEYNLILGHKCRSALRIANNVLKGKWFWQ